MTRSVTGHDETLVYDPKRYAHLVAGFVMAGDQTSTPLKSKTLLHHVLEKLNPQIDQIAIAAEAHINSAAHSIPLIQTISGLDNPISSILAALRHYSTQDDAPRWVLCVPSNLPFLPTNLVSRLTETIVHHPTMIAVAQSGDQRHYDIALWPLSITDRLENYVSESGRSLEAFCDAQDVAWVHMQGPTIDGVTLDPFFKVRTDEDLETAHAIFDILKEERL